jgi:transcriptional regulator with XRE-family HTH domain
MAKKKSPVPVGRKIRKVRLEKKMTLARVANDTGCSIDFLKSVENGEQIPPVGTLLQIARALEIDSGFLLKEQEHAQQERAAAYAKRTDNYAYETLTPGAENKHLKAFRVTIAARKEHEGVGYRHQGEEFVYVLKGEVEIAVGDHLNQLGPTDSLHFNSGITHHMRNTGDAEAELLVVIYNP